MCGGRVAMGNQRPCIAHAGLEKIRPHFLPTATAWCLSFSRVCVHRHYWLSLIHGVRGYYCPPLPLLSTTATAVHYCHCCPLLPLLSITAAVIT